MLAEKVNRLALSAGRQGQHTGRCRVNQVITKVVQTINSQAQAQAPLLTCVNTIEIR